jgi:hypothetical protein
MRTPRRDAAWALALLALGACAERPVATTIAPTGRVGRALSGVDDVTASAQLVPAGRAPLDPVPLSPSDDDVSFSGFLAAAPGDYTLDIVFRGRPPGAPERVFLGRWTSDAFTVERGTIAQPVFRSPIDPIGRPEDGGDEDGDGLGLLDEYLWRADPAATDADGDGVRDGVDCSPGDPSEAGIIAAAGTIEDCDGDGFRRPDIPYLEGARQGLDCDDGDPAIRPGAEDVCDDAIDQDCNPATCPSEDVTPPAIGVPSPAPMRTVGCHQAIEVEIRDDVRVTHATIDYASLEPSGATATVAGAPGDRPDMWRFPPPNRVASGEAPLRAGSRTVRVTAEDAAGNRASAGLVYTFDFARPEVTRLRPARVGRRDAPFRVEVEATAALGLARVELFAAPRGDGATYLVSRSASLGRRSSAPAAFDVDPGELEEGTWLLYPVVEDLAGNRLRPLPSALALPNARMEVETRVDHLCLSSDPPRLPARVLTVDRSSPPGEVGWKSLLEAALAAAAAEDPALELVGITGFGVTGGGRVDLSDATSFTKRWIFGFRPPGSDRAFSMTWVTPALGPPNPVVDPRGSGVTQDAALPNPRDLPDSPAVLSAFGQASRCPGLSGAEGDTVIYQVVQGTPQVYVISAEGGTWRAAFEPGGGLRELFDCE